jgi:hypothetical protein
MDPKRVKSLGYFGLSLGLWLNFPHVALYIGSNLTTLAVTSNALAGMFKFNESGIINSIKIIREGDKEGLLEINASTTPISSETIYTTISDCHAVFSMTNDDQG